MADFVDVRLENDEQWEPILKDSSFYEDCVKDFCKNHPEYYKDAIDLDGYRELIIEVRDKNTNPMKYSATIDKFYNFYIKDLQNSRRQHPS